MSLNERHEIDQTFLTSLKNLFIKFLIVQTILFSIDGISRMTQFLDLMFPFPLSREGEFPGIFSPAHR